MKKAIYIIFTFLLLQACTGGKENSAGTQEGYYTCPMHPAVVSKSPGACPVCNMSLIKVEGGSQKNSADGNYVTLDRQKMILAGIETDTVRYRPIGHSMTYPGIVATDEQHAEIVSSRYNGRIEKLYIKSDGSTVRAGMPLYSVYSEEMTADQKEYLSLLKRTKEGSINDKIIQGLLKESRERLLLRGMTEMQIAELESSGKVKSELLYYAQTPGYVTDVKIKEGMYVEEGTPLFTLISTDDVWIGLQIYPNELSGIQNSKTFQVFIPELPGKEFTGRLVYTNPALEEDKRIYKVRIRISRAGGMLIPGTLVSVRPVADNKPVIAVPGSAIISGLMQVVWVRKHDYTFEQRMVKTGSTNGEWTEILSGVSAGEEVVTEGAYLIESEFILKNGPGMSHEH